MISPQYKRTKNTCHFSNLALSSVFCLPPMLFLIFHEKYGISYTLLGTLVLTNFCTQLLIDLVFSFFSKYFNLKAVIRVMPLLTTLGLTLFAFAPNIFGENIYIGLLLGTVIFSVAAGLNEVLISPVISAIPGSTARDMSLLHSLYAVGVVVTVGLSSLFLKLFGGDNWQILVLYWAALPIISSLLFFISPIPPMNLTHSDGNKKSENKKFGLALCVICIFMGAAAENAMTNWISSYMENALGISKTVGDTLGMAAFAVLLGLGRLIYAKYGKNISTVLLVSMSGAAICYLTAGLSNNVIVSFAACILTGLCTSMLWPGSLILMEEKIPGVSVAGYALMAAGGDFGSSVVAQLVGAVIDNVTLSRWANELAAKNLISTEQIGMRVGMIVASLFPIIGVAVIIYIRRYFSKKQKV